jgi:carbamoyltransferase
VRILGISTTIDAGAALVGDGRLLAAVNEERLTRHKFQCGLPFRSIRTVIDLAGVQPRDLDRVTLSDCTYSLYTDPDDESFARPSASKRLTMFLSELGLLRWALDTPSGLGLYRAAFRVFLERTLVPLRRYLKSLGVTAPLVTCDHHTAHAAAAGMTSGWDDCLVVTMDLSGDGYSSLVALWQDGRLRIVKRIGAYHSFGVFYTYASMFLGHKPGREGKTTGLAAHGDPYATLPIFRRYARYNSLTERVENHARGVACDYGPLTAELRRHTKADIAAGIQRHFEREIARCVRAYARRWGKRRVALAGGVFGNVRVNEVINQLPEVESVYVYPQMGDGGGPAGAALWWENRLTGVRPAAVEQVYLGPRFTNDHCLAALQANPAVRFRRADDVDAELARLLANGKIVARFRGPMEYGPRALGNRSILYHPGDPTINDWLNKRLVRTEYMPFAPSILEEYAGDYFIGWRPTDRAAWFMTITYHATPRCREHAPAVVHIDGTARPQVVRRQHNPSYHRLIDLYRQATGLPIVLNTSFNMHEEPIVCTPTDAVRAFVSARLDALGLEDYLVELR